MARLTLAPLISDARGTVAGVVFSSWKGVNYARKLVIPANPQTTAQQAVRDSMNPCICLWRSLPANVRTWLDKYAVDHQMSGYNWYVHKNRAAEQAKTVHEITPFYAEYPAVADLVLTPAASALTVTWTAPTSGSTTHVMIFDRLMSANAWHHHGSVPASAESYSADNLESAELYEIQVVPFTAEVDEFGQAVADQNTPT